MKPRFRQAVELATEMLRDSGAANLDWTPAYQPTELLFMFRLSIMREFDNHPFCSGRYVIGDRVLDTLCQTAEHDRGAFDLVLKIVITKLLRNEPLSKQVSQFAIRTVDRSGKIYRQNTTRIGKTKSEVGAAAPPKLQNTREVALVPSPDLFPKPAGSAVQDSRNALALLTREALEMEVIGLRSELAEAKDHIRSKVTEIARLKARSSTIIRSLANERDQETREKVKAIKELQRLQEINDGTEKRVKELEATRR